MSVVVSSRSIQFRTIDDLSCLEGRSKTGPKPRGFVVRFYEKVLKLGEDDCWPWNGNRTASGYGVLSIANRPVLTHRIAYALEHGSIDPLLFVLHSCDNPPCCNPKHLTQGTNLDNIEDAKRKNRFQKGSQNGMAKLSDSDVVKIKTRRAGGETLSSIASDFMVRPSAISRIVNGSRWKHVSILPEEIQAFKEAGL